MSEIKYCKLKKRIYLNNIINNADRSFNKLLLRDKSLRNSLFMNKLCSNQATQRLLKKHIMSDNPFALVRFGLFEYMLCYQYVEKRCGLRKEYSRYIKEHIDIDAGMFSTDTKSLEQYSERIIEQLNVIDIMAYWRNIPEKMVFRKFYQDKLKCINVENLYPYPFWHKFDLPDWQLELKEKRVLVVSSFADTIKKQYDKRCCIWKNETILPQFDLLTFKAVQTCGGQRDKRFVTWEEAFKYMLYEIQKVDFDIALISCGSYGIPLAIELKKMGKKVIQWGGCFQLWFGIKGNRWDSNPEINTYINKFWTYPSEEEVPPLSKLVNNSSYWKS